MIWSGNEVGAGYGYGDKDGYGNGAGNGAGYGYGDEDGCGNGSGAGSGYGYGFGDGYGYGNVDGSGIKIGRVNVYDVYSLHPWPYLRIGCEIHTVVFWSENWMYIAKKYGVKISKDEVSKILAEWDQMQEKNRGMRELALFAGSGGPR